MSTNTQVELFDDRMWLEAKLWELPHTGLSDYLLRFPHTHTYFGKESIVTQTH